MCRTHVLCVQLKKGMEVTAELYVKYDVPKKVSTEYPATTASIAHRSSADD